MDQNNINFKISYNSLAKTLDPEVFKKCFIENQELNLQKMQNSLTYLIEFWCNYFNVTKPDITFFETDDFYGFASKDEINIYPPKCFADYVRSFFVVAHECMHRFQFALCKIPRESYKQLGFTKEFANLINKYKISQDGNMGETTYRFEQNELDAYRFQNIIKQKTIDLLKQQGYDVSAIQTCLNNDNKDFKLSVRQAKKEYGEDYLKVVASLCHISSLLASIDFEDKKFSRVKMLGQLVKNYIKQKKGDFISPDELSSMPDEISTKFILNCQKKAYECMPYNFENSKQQILKQNPNQLFIPPFLRGMPKQTQQTNQTKIEKEVVVVNHDDSIMEDCM